jgi:hypothetical protein
VDDFLQVIAEGAFLVVFCSGCQGKANAGAHALPASAKTEQIGRTPPRESRKTHPYPGLLHL